MTFFVCVCVCEKQMILRCITLNNMPCDFVDQTHRLLIKCWRGGTAAVLGVISGRNGAREVKQERISFCPKVSRELIILHVSARFVPSGCSSLPSLSERNERFIVGQPSA